MQNYDNPGSRNESRAVGPMLKSGAAIGGGGNQTQGAGEIPGKVSVPFPEGATKPQANSNKAKAVPGFSGGVIDGKV